VLGCFAPARIMMMAAGVKDVCVRSGADWLAVFDPRYYEA
jgi:hypothetical protein